MGNDTKAAIYDHDTAAHYITVTASIPAADVANILRAKDEYEVGLGILPADFIDDITPDAMRALAPALFPPGHIAARFISPPNECAFIVLRTGIDEPMVRAAMDAELEYARRLGIIEGTAT